MIQLDGKVSVIIPGFNEEKSIFSNLILCDEVLSGLFSDYEIIFVNDGSTDNTDVMAKKALQSIPSLKIVEYSVNQGKGKALREGTAAAQGTYIVFMDADLELPPTQLPTFFSILANENADVVIGSKMHKQSAVNYPISRRLVSFGYFVFIALLFQQKLRDTQTGLKLFKAEVIKPIAKRMYVNRFAFDIEMIVLITKQGWKVVESPVVIEYKREQQWGRIKTRDILQMVTDTFSIFLRLHFSRAYDHIAPHSDQ